MDTPKPIVPTVNALDVAEDRCAHYRMLGYHCSESAIRAGADALGLRLSDDVLRCACGFRGGGGGYHDRCGIIEAGCMLISLLYGRLLPGQAAWRYSYLIRVLHERFQDHFATIYCRDILPPLKERYKVNPCLITYKEGARIVAGVLLEAESLLEQVSDEEKMK